MRGSRAGHRSLVVLSTALVGGAAAAPAVAQPQALAKQPVAHGTGGAAATVDALATSTAIRVLNQGGNAVDAAIAAAAVIGVTEPYSAGIGGGGFMLYRRASDRRVFTIDSRETAPAGATPTMFLDPTTGQPIPFAQRVTSGLGVGVPGTVAGWDLARRRFGTMPFSRLMAPAAQIAETGFVVDRTFAEQTEANRQRFRLFPATQALYLTATGETPAIGTRLRNPDLARTYREIGRRGPAAFYSGPIAADIARTVQQPPVAAGTTTPVRAGTMTTADIAAYRALGRRPVRTTYRGYDIWGMAPPSSGGQAVGEALNILERFPLSGATPATTGESLHRYLEASRLAFADRNAYLGDPAFVRVPIWGLLNKDYAAERAALIGPTALRSPVAAGDPWKYYGPGAAPRVLTGANEQGRSTTHLTVSDRRGNVVAYTFTIESTGGSGITVPGRGFILNNELTDFEPQAGLANSPAPGKRPRSSIAPTIITRDGRIVEALGSPGGATIITTVLQTIVNQIDLGMTLPEAIAAPRASQRNATTTDAEPAFIGAWGDRLRAVGHTFNPTQEIGAATGIAFLRNGRVQAAAEPIRRGGGSAMVQNPTNPFVGPFGRG
jgi:gamma-glutamyltranspeptidase/glutathione hydrolase